MKKILLSKTMGIMNVGILAIAACLVLMGSVWSTPIFIVNSIIGILSANAVKSINGIIINSIFLIMNAGLIIK